MLLWCNRCELDFLAVRSEPFTRCPRCGAKHDGYARDSANHREGAAKLELDADFVDDVRIVSEPPEHGVERFNLIEANPHGTRVLLQGIPAREPLEIVAKEIGRVLRLELPPAVG